MTKERLTEVQLCIHVVGPALLLESKDTLARLKYLFDNMEEIMCHMSTIFDRSCFFMLGTISNAGKMRSWFSCVATSIQWRGHPYWFAKNSSRYCAVMQAIHVLLDVKSRKQC